VSRAPKPQGATPAASQSIPERRRFHHRRQDFHAILAGVAGAGDEQAVGFQGVKRLEGAHRRDGIRAEHEFQLRQRFRSLNRQHRQIVAFAPSRAEAFGDGRDPGQILVAGGGVQHQPVADFAPVVDDQVVNHAACFVQHAGIERLAGIQAGDIVGQQMAQQCAGRRGVGEIHDRHVRHVEQAGGAAHPMVFVELRTVVQRHIPAAEIHQLRPRAAWRAYRGVRLAMRKIPIG
jgi:hypothetical protein